MLRLASSFIFLWSSAQSATCLLLLYWLGNYVIADFVIWWYWQNRQSLSCQSNITFPMFPGNSFSLTFFLHNYADTGNTLTQRVTVSNCWLPAYFVIQNILIRLTILFNNNRCSFSKIQCLYEILVYLDMDNYNTVLICHRDIYQS